MTRLYALSFLDWHRSSKIQRQNLTDDEYGTGMDFAAKLYAAALPDSVNCEVETSTFDLFVFQQNLCEETVLVENGNGRQTTWNNGLLVLMSVAVANKL